MSGARRKRSWKGARPCGPRAEPSSVGQSDPHADVEVSHSSVKPKRRLAAVGNKSEEELPVGIIPQSADEADQLPQGRCTSSGSGERAHQNPFGMTYERVGPIDRQNGTTASKRSGAGTATRAARIPATKRSHLTKHGARDGEGLGNIEDDQPHTGNNKVNGPCVEDRDDASDSNESDKDPQSAEENSLSVDDYEEDSDYPVQGSENFGSDSDHTD